jgi:hypothetical protein
MLRPKKGGSCFSTLTVNTCNIGIGLNIVTLCPFFNLIRQKFIFQPIDVKQKHNCHNIILAILLKNFILIPCTLVGLHFKNVP